MDWILKKLGYIKTSNVEGFRDLRKNPFSEEELSFLLVELLGDMDIKIDEKVEQKMFEEISEVEGFTEYLRITANKDIQRYFGATTPQEQLIIRGSFSRTNYLKTKITSKGKTEKSNLEGLRYGSIAK